MQQQAPPPTAPSRLHAERPEDWRELICRSFIGLDCSVDETSDFFGTIESRCHHSVNIATVSGAAQVVHRTRRRIADSEAHDFYLIMQLDGSSVHVQDERVAQLAAGDFVLHDTSRPYDMHFARPFSQLVLTIPRELASGMAASSRDLTARTISGRTGDGHVAALLMRELREADPATGDISRPVVRSMLDVLAHVLVERTRAHPGSLTEGRRGTLRRITRYIEQNLADTELSCRSIAEAHGLSERYLRMLFSDLGTSPSEWLWLRRLERARDDLLNPALGFRSISSTGYCWGFKEASHFNRAFKLRFGVTPGAFKRRHS